MVTVWGRRVARAQWLGGGEAKQDTKFANHVVCNELLFSLMGISTKEILTEFVLIRVHSKIALKKCEP